jgi:RNA polymerase sigma-70 factor (ECF subfamily)
MERGRDTPDVIARASRGDRAAIGELLERNLPALRVYVRLQAGAWLRQHESCSDLVQSTCRELLENLDGFEHRGEEQFRHWLCVAALNKIRQRHRYHRAERRDPAKEAELPVEQLYGTLLSPSHVAIGQETIERLEAAFDRLPPDYQEVILLCRVVGLSHDEAARRMGRSIDSVRNLLHRALARIAGLADDGH